jgi:hypothetical protein
MTGSPAPRGREAAGHARLSFGGIAIALRSDVPFSSVGFAPSLEPFRSEADDPSDLELSFRYGRPAEAALGGAREVFDSGGLWQLLEDDERLLFALRRMDEGRLYCVAELDRELARGTITCDPAGKTGVRGPLLPDPLDYPLGEALTVCLLAKGRGLLLHACGLELDGRGYLLAGHSGAGKSTLARLAKGRLRVLNDDRVILRMADGGPWIHGTPWHGDCREVSAAGAPLHGLWVIEHGAEHRASPMAAGRAALELLARSFPPRWSAPGMDCSLALLGEVLRRVRCSRLEFTPDPAVFDRLIDLAS